MAGLGAVPRQAGHGRRVSGKKEEQGVGQPLASHGMGEGRAPFSFPLKGDPDLDFVIPVLTALPMGQVVVEPRWVLAPAPTLKEVPV